MLLQTERATLPDEKGKFAQTNGKVEDRIPVGVDGSLIQFYPNFERTMRESIRALVGEDIEKRVEIGLAKDGSGVGGMFSFLRRFVDVLEAHGHFFLAALCALQAIKQH